MEAKNRANQDLLHYDLKKIEELHQECLIWLSEIEFWDLELIIFQKSLSKGNQENLYKDNNFPNETMVGKLIRFKQENINEFKEDLLIHLHCLEGFKSEFNDGEFRDKHIEYKNHILKLKRRFIAFKKELFEYVKRMNR